jgi:hypothetical protein
VLPKVADFVASNKGYETNKYRELAPELRQQIAERWRSYAEQYGYQSPPATASAAAAPQSQFVAARTDIRR